MPDELVSIQGGREYGQASPVDPQAAASARAELARYIKEIFEDFKQARRPYEQIWEECWLNYLGQYQPNLNWKHKTEGKSMRSRIFLKLTTLKCHTAHAKIIDLYAGRGGIPFSAMPVQYEALGLNIDEAKAIASRAQQRLRDHFRLIELEEVMDNAILEMTILGNAVLKGPILETRREPNVMVRTIGGMPVNQIISDVNPYEIGWTETTVPVIDHVPLWEYYCDVNAKSAKDSIGEIQFQRLLPAHFKRLAYQGGFDKEAVLEASLRASLRDADEHYKHIQLGDNYTGERGVKDSRISVLEYQGIVPAGLLRAQGTAVPRDLHDDDGIEAIVHLAADGIVIKAVVNPLRNRQFRNCPYKKRPHSIYGHGVAEAMRDSQKMINSAARLLIDNKALSGNGMVAVNIDRINTKRTTNLDVYPGKTWYIKGNYDPRQAIDSISFNDVTLGLQQLIELMERFADEATGIPKYTTGMQDSFLNKTMGGMSMLISQMNVNLKVPVKNIDDYWIEPIVEDMHDWFMTFAPDTGANIPLRIKATGADSLMAKEIKLEQYAKAMQVTSAPQDAIFVDRVKLMKAIFDLLETTDIMRTDEEIKQIMDHMSAASTAGKDMREIVDIDRLFPLLTAQEQAQVLEQLGIQPDPQRMQGAAAAPPAGQAAASAEPAMPQEVPA